MAQTRAMGLDAAASVGSQMADKRVKVCAKKSVKFDDSQTFLEYFCDGTLAKYPGGKHMEKWIETSSSSNVDDYIGFHTDPFFNDLRLSLDAPDLGPMVCDLFTKIDLTESAEHPNSIPLLAKTVALKCRTFWPVDQGGEKADLEDGIVTCLDSFHESLWTDISDGISGANDSLCAAIGVVVGEWLTDYGIDGYDNKVQRVLTGIFVGTDFATLCGQGERESRWCR